MRKHFLFFVSLILFFTLTTQAQDLDSQSQLNTNQNTTTVETKSPDSILTNSTEAKTVNDSQSPSQNTSSTDIIPSQGFSINSLWRGIL